ncbi:MAG: SEL1-like repeat protein, partial [Thermoguttaceae bacterium]|nr:SEL1-like repeat protein [Thermoguttaceae bacterium]
MKRFGKQIRRLATAVALALIAGFTVNLIGGLLTHKKEEAPSDSSAPTTQVKTQNEKLPVSGKDALRKLAQDPDACFALFIGVDKYDSPPNLSYSSSDAKALRDAVLKIGFRNENVWLCVSDGSRRELPTKKNVDAALADMLAAAEEAGDEATIFISLSGHGFETKDGAAAFCPKDVVADVSAGATPTVTKESAVLVDDLMEKLRNHRARFKMLIVDACRSPAQVKGDDSYERSFRMNVPSGIAFLQSCRSGEASYEDAEFRRSIFTHYFIEGLEGKAENKDGGVTFFDVCGYAAQKTQDRAATTYKVRQTPYFNISGVNFVLKESTRSAADALYREGRALAWGLDGTKIDGARALDLLTQAAEAGLTDAQAALALLYYDGCEATPPDFKKAVYWASRAGDENPIAQNVLGDCYKGGLAVRQDEAEAKRLHEAAFKKFQELAKSGDPMILNLLGRCYCNGRGTELDFGAAREYFRRAAKRCAISVLNLGEMCCEGLGGERDAAEAVRLYNDAIEANCAEAYAVLGNCYSNGRGVERDDKRAIECYRKAAEKKSAFGVANLGVCYANGWGVEKNPEEAVRLYRQASEWNNSVGTYMLAESLLFGRGCPKDQTKALELFKRVAEQDNLEALGYIAACYENAWGVVKDDAYAKIWREREFQAFKKRAEAGSPFAMNRLGDCYYYGNGVEENNEKAVEWYRKAAEKDDAQGLLNLGVCYYNGEGVDENIDEAMSWYRKASAEGNHWAARNLAINYLGEDEAEATRWFCKAAELGNAESAFLAAGRYAQGEHVEQDWNEAAKYLLRACELERGQALAETGAALVFEALSQARKNANVDILEAEF